MWQKINSTQEIARVLQGTTVKIRSKMGWQKYQAKFGEFLAKITTRNFLGVFVSLRYIDDYVLAQMRQREKELINESTSEVDLLV